MPVKKPREASSVVVTVSCISFVSRECDVASRRSPRGAFRSPSKRSPRMTQTRGAKSRIASSESTPRDPGAVVTRRPCRAAPARWGGAVPAAWARAARARGRARGRSGVHREAARAQAMAKDGHCADAFLALAMEANGGRIVSIEQAQDAPSAPSDCPARAHRGGAGAHPEGSELFTGNASRRDRSRTAGRARSRSTRVLIPRRECLLSAPRRRAAARVRVVVRPAERATSRSTFQCARRTRCTPPARALRSPGRTSGWKAPSGWPDPPPPPCRASGRRDPRRRGAPRGPPERRVLSARAGGLRRRASGRVAPRRERGCWRFHGRRAHGRHLAGGCEVGARRRAFYSRMRRWTSRSTKCFETFSDDWTRDDDGLSSVSRARPDRARSGLVAGGRPDEAANPRVRSRQHALRLARRDETGKFVRRHLAARRRSPKRAASSTPSPTTFRQPPGSAWSARRGETNGQTKKKKSGEPNVPVTFAQTDVPSGRAQSAAPTRLAAGAATSSACAPKRRAARGEGRRGRREEQ